MKNLYSVQSNGDVLIHCKCKGKIVDAVVSKEDFAKVASIEGTWYGIESHNKNTTYIEAGIDGKNTRMHRFILEPADDMVVHHINGIGWDNRRHNIEETTILENQRSQVNTHRTNTSGHTGVSFDKSRNKWKAQIKVNNKNVGLGRYDTMEEAIQARKDGEVLYWNKEE